MRLICKRCLGLDLHKKQITACLRVQKRLNHNPTAEQRVFGTMPDQIEQLRQWIIDEKIEAVVMESTSVYWMHVYELIEDHTKPYVVNASHVKKVPGRKTDATDAEWLSELWALGLLKASFIPPKQTRELRAVARYRVRLVAMRTAMRNRTIKLLEMSGIKLSSVVSDCFGLTGRRILDALTQDTPIKAAELASKWFKFEKLADLQRCLGRGLKSAEHRALLKLHLEAYDAADAQLAKAEAKLSELGEPYRAVIAKLDAIPGVNKIAALTLLGELGCDMTAYRSADHLTALAGLAPGNAISASKRRHISARKGNRYLKRVMVQIAWAASRQEGSFFRSRFFRLQSRIGRNKAIVALARQLLVVVYHVLKGDRPFKDLGSLFYDKRNEQRTVDHLTARLAKLGYLVTLEKKPQ